MGKVVRGGQGEDAVITADEEHPFEDAAALIVEKIFVPMAFDQLWNDDDDAAVWVFAGKFKDELHYGNENEAIGRRQEG